MGPAASRSCSKGLQRRGRYQQELCQLHHKLPSAPHQLGMRDGLQHSTQPSAPLRGWLTPSATG